MAYSYGAGGCGGGGAGGLGSYAGGQPAYSAPQQFAPPQGLASYGQSVSSETIDYRSLGVPGPSYGSGGYGGNPCPQGGASSYPQQSYGSPPTYSAPQYGQPGPQYGSPQPYGGANSGSYPAQIDINDPQLNQQVEQIVASLTTVKRPMLRRQVITVPANCPPRVAYIHRRLPTPPPDIVERITVVKPPRDIVNLCIEKPCQPGPCYQSREICGKPRKPLIQPRVVSVQPRSNPCQQQQASPPPPPPPPPPAPANPCCPQSQPSYGGGAGSPYGFGGPAAAGGYGAPTSYGGSYAQGSTTGFPQAAPPQGGYYGGAPSGGYPC